MGIGRVGRRTVEFWFELASPYSYLSALRIDALSAASGVAVTWRPFVLGAIFKNQGLTTSPFNVDAAKGRHMWRDVERRAATYRLPFRPPTPFPQNSLLAHRVALVGLDADWGKAFVLEAYRAGFANDQDVGSPEVLGTCVAWAGGEPGRALAEAGLTETKERLHDATAEACSKGVFGAPSFVVGDELFWGDDRLEDAIQWAVGGHALQQA